MRRIVRGKVHHLVLLCVVLAACGDEAAQQSDASAGDAGADDAAVAPDGPAADAARGGDDATVGDASAPADGAAPDASRPDARPPDAAPSPDAEPPGPIEEHVHILIDNFCNTSASPTSVTVPAGDTVQLTYHNHSVDYDADVWLSYGGGYLGLVTGGTWADQFTFCATPDPYTAYADISIAGGGGSACPGFRLYIDCQ